MASIFAITRSCAFWSNAGRGHREAMPTAREAPVRRRLNPVMPFITTPHLAMADFLRHPADSASGRSWGIVHHRPIVVPPGDDRCRHGDRFCGNDLLDLVSDLKPPVRTFTVARARVNCSAVDGLRSIFGNIHVVWSLPSTDLHVLACYASRLGPTRPLTGSGTSVENLRR